MSTSATTAAAIYGRPTFAKRLEQAVLWLLRLSTYFVLLCAAFIFWDIGTKGGAVVFQRSAPFINVPFLTEAPETLNVFELDGRKTTMGDRAFRVFKAAHEAELKGVRVESYVYSAGGIFPNWAMRINPICDIQYTNASETVITNAADLPAFREDTPNGTPNKASSKQAGGNEKRR